MVKMKWRTSVWKLTFTACVLGSPLDGLNGYPWLNGGTTPTSILLFRPHHMKLSTTKLLRSNYPSCLGKLLTQLLTGLWVKGNKWFSCWNFTLPEPKIEWPSRLTSTDLIVFVIGDFFYLKLQPYRQFTMRHSSFHKLLPKYYAPFQVLERIGSMVYQLQLLPNVEVHYVFHISQLKLWTNPHVTTIHPLPANSTMSFKKEKPEAILDRKMEH